VAENGVPVGLQMVAVGVEGMTDLMGMDMNWIGPLESQQLSFLGTQAERNELVEAVVVVQEEGGFPLLWWRVRLVS